MKKLTKLLALLLALAMVFSVLTACSDKDDPAPGGTSDPAPAGNEDKTPEGDKPPDAPAPSWCKDPKDLLDRDGNPVPLSLDMAKTTQMNFDGPIPTEAELASGRADFLAPGHMFIADVKNAELNDYLEARKAGR